MREQLRLTLLGGLRVMLGGSVVDDFTSKKSLALLAYLAMSGRAHSRETLSGLLWGESSTSQARASLRTVLWDLRQQLPSFVTADRQTISFNSGPSCWIDAVALREATEKALRRSGAPSGQDEDRALLTDDQVGALEEAVSLYRGDFMAGFFVSDARQFEDWMLRERESARQLVLQALHRLLLHHKAKRAYRSGIDAASQLLTIAPWQEEIHRELMRLLVLDGQRSAALVQYETCREMLAEELGVEPTIETRLLYRRIKAGRPIDEGRMVTSPSSVNANPQCPDLRPEMHSFIGRDDEMAALKQLLSEPGARLVTLVGVDGVGKTCLAWSVAEQVAGSFEHGAWFIPLRAQEAEAASCLHGSGTDRPASDPFPESEPALKIARVLGLAISARTPALRQLSDHLGHREAFLILDDFAPSAAEVGLVVDLLHHAPYVRLLVIAEQPLGVESEQVLHLNGLGLPPRAVGEAPARERPDQLMAYDSVRVFVERAKRASPDFELTAGNARHVTRICRLAAGLPLGIELATAWVGKLAPDEIVRDIEYRLKASRGDRGGRRAARPALRALFFHSWDHLSSAERLALSQLACFQDQFGEDAALEIGGVLAAALQDLAKKGLLIRRASGRYDWHPALRRFTLGTSQAPAFSSEAWEYPIDIGALQERYRTHYMEALAEQAPALCGLRAKAAAAAIQCDWTHIRRAWYSAVDHVDVELLGRGLEGLSRFLLMQGWLREGVELLEGAAHGLRDRCEVSEDAACRALIVRLLIEQARFLNAQSLSERARRAAESVIELVRDAEREPGSAGPWRAMEAAGYREWGRALYTQGELRAATERLDEALALTGDGRAPEVRASILVRLGIIELESEELGRAQEHLDEAFSLYEKLEDSRGRSQLLNALALTAARRADLAAARTYAQEALSVSQTIGDRGLESVAHTNLGSIANAREDYETATSHCAQALRIARQLGDPRAEAQALTELALAHLREGKKEAAWRRSLLAVELARASGDRAIEARALLVSGHAFTELEMTDQALDAYEQARQLQARLGQSGQMIESVAGLARVSLANGDLAEAQAFVEEILSRLKECGLAGVGEPLRVYLACYQVLEANHDPRARDVLITASGLYEETPPQ